MDVRHHLTFANVASATALLVAVTGVGGLAVADGAAGSFAKGLAKNSVKSKQIKNGTISDKDLKDGAVSGAKIADGAVTGADVLESSLGTVPSAGSAGSADSAANSGDVLRAVVAANGGLVAARSEHAVSSTGANGFYTVVFDRNVSTCTTVVTAGLLNDNSPFGAHSSAAVSVTNPNAVVVYTLSASSNSLTAYPFQLVVAC